MKTIFLLRHADANPTDFSGYDQERALSVNGLLQIERLRAEEFWKEVDFALCSGVKRAKQTFESLKLVMSPQVKFVFDDALYKATRTDLMDKIQWIPALYDRLLVVGHNPALTQFVEEVLPGQAVDGVRTAEVIRLEADVPSWQDVNFNRLAVKARIRSKIDDK